MASLGRLGLEELEPRGDGDEEAAHGDARTRWRAGGDHRPHAPLIHSHLRARRRAARPAGERHPRHRRDARQRLAAKPQCADALQIVYRGDLAGRVALERQRQLLRRDARAVIHHADQVQPAALQLDTHGASPSVQRVLHQLLDHRGWALHDLAGGDLRRHIRW